MWTLGYDDNGGEFCFSEAFNGGRKLRPLVPRPLSSLRPNNVNFSSRYCYLGNVLNEERKRELLKNEKSSSSPIVVSSSRWNPTAEQLRILEELYRRGTRTPSADQIQHITAQLRRYGKIEGKNVFYWFQNHKARERQKRRRQTAPHQTKYSEAEKRYEIEETKTKCSTLLSKECTETHRTTKVVEKQQDTTRNTQHLNSVIESHNEDERHNDVDIDDNEYSKTTTLQLFPLRSTKFYKYDGEREGRRDYRPDDQIVSDSDMTKNFTLAPSCSLQFFEFLPLKN